MLLNIEDLNLHPYTELTPIMDDGQFEALKMDIKENGQLEPIRVCRNLVYDGRHRMRALKELNIKKIEALVDNDLIDEEIKTRVMSHENRRHQTPTQIAISAFREYLKQKEDKDVKTSQDKVAKQFGISRKNLAEVKSLHEKRPDIIEDLYNGMKFNIGSESAPSFTNNVRALNAFFRDDKSKRLSKPKDTMFSDEEVFRFKEIKNRIIQEEGVEAMLFISKLVLAEAKEHERKNQ